MIKPFAKRGFIWADQMALPWSDTTKLPIGVAVVQVSQVPKWNRGIYADQEAWQWFEFDQAPKWFCGLRPIKRRDWFRRDQVPKWSGGSPLSRGIALVRTWPSPQVMFIKLSRGKLEAALEQLHVTTRDVKEQIPRFSWGSGLL